MSGIDCERPDHERCDRCGGCVPCGCLCHLAGDEQAEQPEEQLFVELGLREFQQEVSCPKCNTAQYQMVFHPNIILTVGDTAEGDFPCGQWVRQGLLTPIVTQHLCVRCLRCGYGFPMKTADG